MKTKIDEKKIADTFLEFIKIDSPSGKEAEFKKHLKKKLKDLGLNTKEDKFGNLIAKKKGEGNPILLSTHLDTVHPGEGIEPQVSGKVIKSKGETILGADDKAGIAEVLEAVEYILENNIPHRDIELLFTLQEEKGLQGAFNTKASDFRSKEAVILDIPGKPLKVCSAAPFIYKIDISVEGKLAHAGVNPDKGINAIGISSKAIAKLKWGKIDSETTTNVGTIEGGTVRNSVPAKTQIKAEARSHTEEKAKKQIEKMKNVFNEEVKKAGAKVKFNIEKTCGGYKLDKDDPLLKDLEETAQKLGLKTEFEKSGGASDANALAGKGFKVADISYGGGGAHTIKEYIKTNEMRQMANFLIEYLKAE